MFAQLFTFLASLYRPATTRVRVFHNNDVPAAWSTGYRDEHTVTQVLTYDVAAPRTEQEVLALVEEAFRLCNDDPTLTADKRARAYRFRRNRSLSVGDVVGVGPRFYACARSGWRALPAAPCIEQRAGHGTTPLDEVSAPPVTRTLEELLRRSAAGLAGRLRRARGR